MLQKKIHDSHAKNEDTSMQELENNPPLIEGVPSEVIVAIVLLALYRRRDNE